MYNLKKSITGKYNANDVDKLLLKVRGDYEACLDEQKEFITKLKNENRQLSERLKKFLNNERYIIAAITRAEETAQSIIAGAKQQAAQDLISLRSEERQLRLSVSGGYERLKKLGEVSESISQAVSKVLGDGDDKKQKPRPIKNIYRAK